MRIPYLRRLVAVLLLTFIGVPEGLSSTDLPIDLTLAIERALGANPRLAGAPLERQAGEGRLLQTRQKPNLALDLTVENLLGGGAFRNFDGSETTLSLVWVLERGKQEQRVATAQAGLVRTDSRLRLQRLAVAADTTSAYLEVLHDQERLIQTGQAVAAAQGAIAAVRRRVDAGGSPAADLARAEVDMAWVELQREDVEHQLLVARKKLAATWGAREPDFQAVTGDLRVLPQPVSYETLLADLADSPAINRYLTEQRVREAQVRLEEARARPNWEISAGARYLALVDETAFVASLSVPLAARAQNQGRIAESRAMVALNAVERTATRMAIETVLFELHQELTHNIHTADAIRETVLPRVRQVLADTQAAYQIGSLGFQDLRLAQRELLAAESELLEESFRAHRNVAEIERLTGRALSEQGGES
jgi:cobalt-zinc-cadmium efflux system outer membrane protein